MNTNFTSPDFYHIDDLLSEEHKLIRESTRQWVSKSVCPIIEDYAQKAEFPKHLIKELGEIGAFGPYIPQKYGGAGLDQISYGIMMKLKEEIVELDLQLLFSHHLSCTQFGNLEVKNKNRSFFQN